MRYRYDVVQHSEYRGASIATLLVQDALQYSCDIFMMCSIQNTVAPPIATLLVQDALQYSCDIFTMLCSIQNTLAPLIATPFCAQSLQYSRYLYDVRHSEYRGASYRHPIGTRCSTIFMRYLHDVVQHSEYRGASYRHPIEYKILTIFIDIFMMLCSIQNTWHLLSLPY
ncbi:hypothetical protein AVEN_189940-1 [Araneus ventricosus]|uniref:Uncharacterized protein n=1 Tax=Araneus ventricosus TaxID=182803 RepID=A0A4Y2F3S1_ARAVE|nr:hypothetical protein AVEN_189940-1 [Araneus ventricosus]